MADKSQHICAGDSGQGHSCKGGCNGTCDEHDTGDRAHYGAHLPHPPMGKAYNFRQSATPDADLINKAIEEGF